jgi:hypothetical protein
MARLRLYGSFFHTRGRLPQPILAITKGLAVEGRWEFVSRPKNFKVLNNHFSTIFFSNLGAYRLLQRLRGRNPVGQRDS